MTNEIHYVCTGGCEGVSETPGTCQATDCADHKKSLKECTCTDQQHTELMNEASEND